MDRCAWCLTSRTNGNFQSRFDFQDGCFQLGNQTYYVQKKLHGQYVIVWVDGQRREFAIFANGQLVKKLPIKGLQNRLMSLPDYLELMCNQAVAAWRRILRRTPTYRQVTM